VSRPFALVAGSGGPLGQALLAEFSDAGYVVAGLRKADCDLADPAAAEHHIAQLTATHGPVDVLIFNAGHLLIAPFLELDAADFDTCWRAGPAGAANCARAVLPHMLQQGRGSMVFTGATMSLRGSSGFSAMASGKFGLRGLAQSLAREFQPRGIHVAHVLLDGLLDGSPSTQRFGERDAAPLDPRAVAASYRWLVEQAPTAWTHELDLRTSTEKF